MFAFLFAILFDIKKDVLKQSQAKVGTEAGKDRNCAYLSPYLCLPPFRSFLSREWVAVFFTHIWLILYLIHQAVEGSGVQLVDPK